MTLGEQLDNPKRVPKKRKKPHDKSPHQQEPTDLERVRRSVDEFAQRLQVSDEICSEAFEMISDAITGVSNRTENPPI